MAVNRSFVNIHVRPQALRNISPSLITQFIPLCKDTSLAYVMGVRELTRSGYISSQREFRPFALSMFVVIVFWPCTWTMSRPAMQLEMWLAPDRSIPTMEAIGSPSSTGMKGRLKGAES